MIRQLEALEIEYMQVENGQRLEIKVKDAVRMMNARSASFYWRVYAVNRFECLELLAPLITDHLVIASLSGHRVEWVSFATTKATC